MRTPVLLLSSFLSLAACHSSDHAPAPSSSTTTTSTADVGGPNLLVPPELAGKLRFEKTKVDDGAFNSRVIDMFQPVGWQRVFKDMPGMLKADEHTSVSFSWTCDGMCAPKKWEPIVERSFPQWAFKTMLAEEKQEGSWLRVVQGGPWESDKEKTIWVGYARWNDKDSGYFSCHAQLEGDYRVAWKAFADMCSKAALR